MERCLVRNACCSMSFVSRPTIFLWRMFSRARTAILSTHTSFALRESVFMIRSISMSTTPPPRSSRSRHSIAARTPKLLSKWTDPEIQANAKIVAKWGRHPFGAARFFALLRCFAARCATASNSASAASVCGTIFCTPGNDSRQAV
ncbi:MAG: hypothetical protein ACI91F_002559 [Candidatus Binatia bacterium]|jgi:hypothetical protein